MIKTFETFIHLDTPKPYSQYDIYFISRLEFRLGDFVKLKEDKDFYQVVSIDTNDDTEPYKIRNVLSKSVPERWVNENEIEEAEEYEISANKYNI